MAMPITIGAAGGEYMESVVVLEWTAKVGDSVKQGDIIVTVETAKAATDIEAPCDGILSAVFAEVGAEVPVADVLGLIGKSIDDLEVNAPATSAMDEDPAAHAVLNAAGAATLWTIDGRALHGRTVASPAARRAAISIGLDLGGIAASSPTGRLKLRDLSHAASAPTAGDPSADHGGSLKIYRTGDDQGMPVLLLHGFGADAMSWYPLERNLAKLRKVVKLDLPNHGQSPKRRTPNFEALVNEVIAAFDALGIQAVHLVGHSLGGACALALASRRPGQVASLTLIAPGGLGKTINGEFVRSLARASTPASLRQALELMVADKGLISAEFVGAAMAGRAEPALRAAQQQMAEDLFPGGVPGFDLRAMLEQIGCPTRIIWGKADEVLPVDQARSAPGQVGLHLFDDVGHVPHIEITDRVMNILESVLKAE